MAVGTHQNDLAGLIGRYDQADSQLLKERGQIVRVDAVQRLFRRRGRMLRGHVTIFVHQRGLVTARKLLAACDFRNVACLFNPMAGESPCLQ